MKQGNCRSRNGIYMDFYNFATGTCPISNTVKRINGTQSRGLEHGNSTKKLKARGSCADLRMLEVRSSALTGDIIEQRQVSEKTASYGFPYSAS